ncbi:universal stress protein [Amycolatopsis pittospori]|uniref:universal stress protein n=1 Tax=Amycolatopsis pittospori TaxID=2749434 RepID=UPI002E2DF175|nr:universal stress protein [Amycolatopsis pittospori]
MSERWGSTKPVVAGVDGSESATEAVRWAAGEAVRRETSLRLVHAYSSTGDDYPNLEVTAAEVRAALRETAMKRLRLAKPAAWAVAPSLEIETEVREGDPRPVLIDESKHALVLAVGSRGLNGVGRLVLGSSALAMAVHGRCPLVVVRGARSRSGPVLVGVDSWSASASAVRFAFEEAARLRTSVTVLRTWSDLNLADSVTVQDAERQALETKVATVADWFPDVPFDCLVVRGRPAKVLKEYGERAGLIVVGTRGRNGFTGLLFGSVSQNLTGHAPCPVAVVRSDVVLPGAAGIPESLLLEGDGA